MSFLESQAKAGYYPTPPELLPSIAAFVKPRPEPCPEQSRRAVEGPGKGGRLLDPCCGEGTAAAELAKAWNLKGYGIEIHHERALNASLVLEQVIEDDYAAVSASHNFSVLFLNPPYDYSETAGRRLEYEFLRDTTRYLVPDGILVYLIPGYRIAAHDRIAVYLSTHYTDIRLYRFPDPHYAEFKQVVIFGRKKAEPWRDDKAATGLINQIAGNTLSTLPSPPSPLPAPRYTLPDPPASPLVFHSTQLDWDAAAKEALECGVWASREWAGLNLEVKPELAKDTLIHGGFHAGVDAFAQDTGGLVLLSLIGRETHVKALWASLMANQVLQFRPGLNFAKGQAGMYTTLKARLPNTGAAHWVILHKRATVEGTEPVTKTTVQDAPDQEEEEETAFYVFSPGDGNFLAQLGKAMLLPTLPGWGPHLAQEGQRRGKLSWIPKRLTHGCEVCRVLPSTLAWRSLISYGIEDGLLDTSPENVERAQARSSLIPAMPLKRGHIARLLEAGLLDNVVIQSESSAPVEFIVGQDGKPQARKAIRRLILRGRTVQIQQQVPTGKPNVEITRTRYITEILAVDLDTGEMQHITDDKALARFIEEWQEELAQAVVSQFEPRYRFDYADRLSSLQLELLNEVLAKRCHLPGRAATGLLEGQKHVATAAYEVLKKSKFAIVVGEMGIGKTKVGVAVAGLRELDRGAFPVLTLCPPHLAEKWAREWRETWPKCLPIVLKSPHDVDDFARMAASPNGYHYVGIVTSTMASLGSGWEPAARPSIRNRHLLTCPDCGQVVRDTEEAPLKESDLTDRQQSCLACGSPLWQFTNQARRSEEQPGLTDLGQVQRLVQAGKWSFFHESQPTPSRWPLADYIVRRHPRLFKMLIVDEAHQYKGESADRAYAFGNLANTIPATLLLTGTLFGGMAPSLFYLLYRIDGRLRRMFEYEDVQGFTEKYGVLERETRYYDEVSDDGHSMAGNRRRRTIVRPRPGISPAMVTLLLDTTLFVRVSDLGIELPPLEEIPVVLHMDEQHGTEYDTFYTKALEALMEAKEYGTDLAGSFLQNLMGYCTAPFRVHQVTSKDEEGEVDHVWAEAPDLEVVCAHCGRFLKGLNERCLDCHPIPVEEDEEKRKMLDVIPIGCAGGCGVKRQRIFPQERWLIDLVKSERSQGRTFDPDGDVDRVSFTLVAGYEYRLYTSALAAGVDTTLVVETGTGETYANDDAGPGTLASEVTFTPVAGGVATATLSNRINQYGPERSYRLTLQAEAVPTPTPTGTPAPGDAYEVDDVTPRPIGLGETQQHSFDPGGDVDKIVLEVKPGRWYEVKTGNLAFNVDTQIAVELTGSGRVYENDDAQPGTLSSRVLFQGQITEMVVVTVENRRGMYGEGLTYTIYAGEYYPGPGDAYEPDDEPAQAAPIGIGESQSRSFHVDTDVDRACFPVKSGRRYTVQTANLAYGVDTVLEVEVGGNHYESDDVGAGDLASSVEFETAGDSTASIMVYNETGWGGDDKTYVLRVTEATATPTPPPADPYEPDGPDTPVTYLVGDEPQRRVFQAEGDTDHIRFMVKAGTCYEITTSELAPGVDTVIQVHRWNGSDWVGVGSNDDWPNKMTYASYFALTSQEDTDVRVDVTNRGNAWGRQATYAIGVRVTQPTPTPRPTATPTLALPPTPRPESSSPPTATATPVSTPTPAGSSNSSSGSGSKPTGGKGILAVLVFVDENKNNVYDVGVEGVQGMRVLLVNTRTPHKAAEQQTDATGYARFAAEEGAYNLLIPQLGYAQSQDLVGGENVAIPIPLPPLVLPPQLP